MKSILSTSAAAVAAIVVGVSAAAAQTGTSPYPAPSQEKPGTDRGTKTVAASSDETTLGYSDRRFVKRAAELGTEEVAVSQIVARAPIDSRVRDFATEMVSSHEKVNDELAGLASRKGMQLANDHESMSRWTKEDPKSLATDYVSHMESAHEKLINLFEKAAQSDDADISAFATKYLPDLRKHYTMVRELRKAING